MQWLALTGRNGRPMTFHATAEDYIQTGKVLCNRVMFKTGVGWTTGQYHPAAHLKTCKRCEKKAGKHHD